MYTSNRVSFSKTSKRLAFRNLLLMTAMVTASCNMGTEEATNTQKNAACLFADKLSSDLQLSGLISSGGYFTLSYGEGFSTTRVGAIYVAESNNRARKIDMEDVADCTQGTSCSIPKDKVLQHLGSLSNGATEIRLPIFAGVSQGVDGPIVVRSSNYLELTPTANGYEGKYWPCGASSSSLPSSSTNSTGTSICPWPNDWNRELACSVRPKIDTWTSNGQSKPQTRITLRLADDSFDFVHQDLSNTHTAHNGGGILFERASEGCLYSASSTTNVEFDCDDDGTFVRYRPQGSTGTIYEDPTCTRNPQDSSGLQITKLDLRMKPDGQQMLGGVTTQEGGSTTEYYIESCWTN